MSEIPVRARCSGLCAMHCGGVFRTGTASRYDPVPDLASLIDVVTEMARIGASDQGARDDLLESVLLLLLTGPYARLRSGLLLDEPDHENHGATADALRAALPNARPGTGDSNG